MAFKHNFVTALPAILEASSVYFLNGSDSTSAELYVTDLTGAAVPIATDAIIRAFAATEAAIAVNALVGAAPITLDTLAELAQAFDNNPDIITNLVTQMGTKADAANVYTKDEVDSQGIVFQAALDEKADLGVSYSKAESDAAEIVMQTAIDAKAAASNVYTKEESDAAEIVLQTAIDGKQDWMANATSLAKYGEGTFDGKPIATLGLVQW
jgi:plasmid maintenance system antidote protein VapI